MEQLRSVQTQKKSAGEKNKNSVLSFNFKMSRAAQRTSLCLIPHTLHMGFFKLQEKKCQVRKISFLPILVCFSPEFSQKDGERGFSSAGAVFLQKTRKKKKFDPGLFLF
ncbi:MAG TPA: hypothetical protein PKY88_06610 [Anaerohalosphaeraceae bacterium]|nr:hypothetical protein [Anaerohalosphaeraceae bacterium]